MSQLAPRAKYPSAKFDVQGKHCKGTVIEPTEDRQARKYNSTDLAYWPDGSPVMQTRIVLRQANGDVVAVYASGRMASAIRKALAEAGAGDVEVGGDLDVWWSTSEPSKGGGFPAKLYKATYLLPAAATDPGADDPWADVPPPDDEPPF